MNPKILLAFASIGFVSTDASAFKLVPMSATFDPAGPGASKSFIIENDSKEKTAVQVSMRGRKMDLNGKEEHPAAEKEFMVYPTQLVLQPGEKRSVRVTWTGPKEIGSELAFRIVAEQLPVQGLKQQNQLGAEIQILLKYEGSVYVEPQNVKSNIGVETAILLQEGKQKKLAITIANTGTKHQILHEPKLKLTVRGNDTKELELDTAALKELNGQNVLASSRRKFLVSWPKEFPEGPVQARLEIKE